MYMLQRKELTGFQKAEITALSRQENNTQLVRNCTFLDKLYPAFNSDINNVNLPQIFLNLVDHEKPPPRLIGGSFEQY